MWGKGSKMATQASPLPQVAGQRVKSGGSIPPPHPRGDPPKWPARDLPKTRHLSRDQGRGKTRHFSKYWLIKGYFKRPTSQNLSAKLASSLLQCQSLPISFLWAVRRENVPYIAAQAYIRRAKTTRHAQSATLLYILQATSLQKAVNIKNKAGHNSTRGTVSSLFFSHWKYCCTQSTYSASFMWTEVIDSRLL